MADGRFALLSKTHHALVDGISGVDIATVLFDSSPDPMPVSQPDSEWIPRPLPTKAQLLADAVVERGTVPGEVVRGDDDLFQIADGPLRWVRCQIQPRHDSAGQNGGIVVFTEGMYRAPFSTLWCSGDDPPLRTRRRRYAIAIFIDG